MRSLLTRFKTSAVFPATIATLVAAAGAHAEETCASILLVYGPIEWWWCSLVGPYGNSCIYSCVNIARTAIVGY
jgi:hypothetical protein